jgi:hypothetical protein
MKRIMGISMKVPSNATGVSAQPGMIPVLRSLNRHQVCNPLEAKLDSNREESAKWQLTDAVFLGF